MRSLSCLAVTLLAFSASAMGEEKLDEQERVPLVMPAARPGCNMRTSRDIWNDPRYERLAINPNETALTVRRGAVNLALGTGVTSSTADPVFGRVSQITDGKNESWEASLVELDAGVQWVQIDLLESCSIDWIGVWHRWQQGDDVCHGIVVQVSNDVQFKAGVTTLFNNDRTGSAGQGKGADREYVESWNPKLIDGRGVAGRYVRLYSNGAICSGMNDYSEVVVLGIPGPIQRGRRAEWAGDFFRVLGESRKPVEKLRQIRLMKRVDLSGAWPVQRWAMAEPEQWLASAEELVLSPGLVRPEALNALPKLRRVEVEWRRFDRGADLTGMERVAKLRALWVREAGLRQDDLERIAKMTGLEELDLRGNPLTDQDVLRLRTLTAMKRLKLDAGELTGAALQVLDEMPALEEVYLGGWKGANLDWLAKRGVRVRE